MLEFIESGLVGRLAYSRNYKGQSSKCTQSAISLSLLNTMPNNPGAQSSSNLEAQDQHSDDPVRMGYTAHTVDGIDFTVPNAFKELPMELAWMIKPDVSEALKMAGPVCFLSSDPDSA